MTARRVVQAGCVLLAMVAATATVIAVALLATDVDRHVRALAVLPPSALAGAVAGFGLLATRRGAR